MVRPPRIVFLVVTTIIGLLAAGCVAVVIFFIWQESRINQAAAGPCTNTGSRMAIASDAQRAPESDRDSPSMRWCYVAPQPEPGQRLVTGDQVLATDGVVIFDFNGNVYAVDASSGALRWTLPFNLEPLILANGLLVGNQPSEHEVVALDPETGGTRWRMELPGVTVLASHGDRIFLVSKDSPGEDASVAALDLKTGDTIWKQPARDSDGSAILAWDDVLIVAANQGRVSSLDPADGSERWVDHFGKLQVHSEVAGSPDANLVVLNLGRTIHGLDAISGLERWTVSSPGRGQPWLTMIGTTVIAAYQVDRSETGGMIMMIDAGSGRTRWSHDADAGQVWFEAFDGERVVITAGGALEALDAATGESLWRKEAQRSVLASASYTSAAVSENALFAITWNGYLIGLDPATGEEEWRIGVGGGYETGAGPDGVLVVAGSVYVWDVNELYAFVAE